MNHTSLFFRSAVGMGMVALVWHGAAAAQDVTYPRDPQTVVASYVLTIGEITDPDPGPSVRIYGDGRVVIHVPRYMKNAGNFQVQLSEAEMDAVMSSLSSTELLEFDPTAVHRAKDDSARLNRGGAASAAVLVADTDPSITTIEVRVRPTAAVGATARAADVSKKISWTGVESDAKRFPDVPAIQKLAAAKKRLGGLMERSDLQRID